MKLLDGGAWLNVLQRQRQPYHDNYYAMYSSLLDGVVTDPTLMLLPIDDHLVHRGDGVFESAKCVNGAIYNLEGHLERLERSASSLHFQLPWTRGDIADRITDTIRAADRPDCMIRIVVSRGPGSMGVSPLDTAGPQLYIMIYKLPLPFMELHPEGAIAISSSVPVKQAFFAGVKCCNYLPNVLMQKEATEAGADFAIGFDERGCLAEGATENIGIVTTDGRLLFPSLDFVLRGTTMVRVMELALALIKEDALTAVDYANITRQDIQDAAEVLVVGTTRDVTTVRQFDNRHINDGEPGQVFRALSSRLLHDIHHNPQMRTNVFA